MNLPRDRDRPAPAHAKSTHKRLTPNPSEKPRRQPPHPNTADQAAISAETLINHRQTSRGTTHPQRNGPNAGTASYSQTRATFQSAALNISSCTTRSHACPLSDLPAILSFQNLVSIPKTKKFTFSLTPVEREPMITAMQSVGEAFRTRSLESRIWQDEIPCLALPCLALPWGFCPRVAVRPAGFRRKKSGSLTGQLDWTPPIPRRMSTTSERFWPTGRCYNISFAFRIPRAVPSGC